MSFEGDRKNTKNQYKKSFFRVYGVMLDQKAVSRIELLDRIVSDYELWALSQVLKLKMEDLLEP